MQIMYIADDGKPFEDAQACSAYEGVLKAIEGFFRVMKLYNATGEIISYKFKFSNGNDIDAFLNRINFIEVTSLALMPTVNRALANIGISYKFPEDRLGWHYYEDGWHHIPDHYILDLNDLAFPAE